MRNVNLVMLCKRAVVFGQFEGSKKIVDVGRSQRNGRSGLRLRISLINRYMLKKELLNPDEPSHAQKSTLFCSGYH